MRRRREKGKKCPNWIRVPVYRVSRHRDVRTSRRPDYSGTYPLVCAPGSRRDAVGAVRWTTSGRISVHDVEITRTDARLSGSLDLSHKRMAHRNPV